MHQCWGVFNGICKSMYSSLLHGVKLWEDMGSIRNYMSELIGGQLDGSGPYLKRSEKWPDMQCRAQPFQVLSTVTKLRLS